MKKSGKGGKERRMMIKERRGKTGIGEHDGKRGEKEGWRKSRGLGRKRRRKNGMGKEQMWRI